MLQVGAEVFALETSPSVTRDFRARFDRQPFLFRHHLAGDARFKLDRIREVAAHVGNRASFTGQLQAGAPFFVQPADQAMTFDDALSALESGRSWIILKHLEKDAAYAPLLDACIGEASAIVERDLEPLIE